MRIYTPDEARLEKDQLLRDIVTGKLFIHPTDTIYGLGCNAMNQSAVLALRDAKRQIERPFSIMVPSVEWIHKNCEMTPLAEQWLLKLPGPYTLIMNLKNKKAIAPAVNLGQDTIGVRIPEHWFVNLLNEADIPIITTSANITGEGFMTSKDNLDPQIKLRCSFMLDEGIKMGKPSTIVNLSSDSVHIRERK